MNDPRTRLSRPILGEHVAAERGVAAGPAARRGDWEPRPSPIKEPRAPGPVRPRPLAEVPVGPYAPQLIRLIVRPTVLWPGMAYKVPAPDRRLAPRESLAPARVDPLPRPRFERALDTVVHPRSAARPRISASAWLGEDTP